MWKVVAVKSFNVTAAMAPIENVTALTDAYADVVARVENIVVA